MKSNALQNSGTPPALELCNFSLEDTLRREETADTVCVLFLMVHQKHFKGRFVVAVSFAKRACLSLNVHEAGFTHSVCLSLLKKI